MQPTKTVSWSSLSPSKITSSELITVSITQEYSLFVSTHWSLVDGSIFHSTNAFHRLHFYWGCATKLMSEPPCGVTQCTGSKVTLVGIQLSGVFTIALGPRWHSATRVNANQVYWVYCRASTNSRNTGSYCFLTLVFKFAKTFVYRALTSY